MYLFNKDEILTKYENIDMIIDQFMEVRLAFYETRKQNRIKELESLLVLYSNKHRFISELLADTLDLRKKKAQVIDEMLEIKQYDKIESSYHYLTKMHMDMVNEENVTKLNFEYTQTQESLSVLKAKTIQEMYLEELKELNERI